MKKILLMRNAAFYKSGPREGRLTRESLAKIEATAREIPEEDTPDAIVFRDGMESGQTAWRAADAFKQARDRIIPVVHAGAPILSPHGALSRIHARTAIVLAVMDVKTLSETERAFGNPPAPLPDKGGIVSYTTEADTCLMTDSICRNAKYERTFG